MFNRRRKMRRALSAYIDGELAPSLRDHLGEQLAFDDQLRSELAQLESTDALVHQALEPVHIPAPASIQPAQEIAAPPSITTPSRRRLTPVALAAAGLLVTAGITLASLRRRGIV